MSPYPSQPLISRANPVAILRGAACRNVVILAKLSEIRKAGAEKRNVVTLCDCVILQGDHNRQCS